MRVCLALKTKCVAILQAQAVLRPEEHIADLLREDWTWTLMSSAGFPAVWYIHVGCRRALLVGSGSTLVISSRDYSTPASNSFSLHRIDRQARY